jgi:DNA-binding response OmpR family regulator
VGDDRRGTGNSCAPAPVGVGTAVARDDVWVPRNPDRILIVEDHEATRRGLQELLTNAGYVVLSASTFAEGRRALAEQAPDLLIADLRLGEYNGLQLVATAPLALPSIIVTGFPDPVLEAQALKLGAHFITKPIAVEPLLTLINSTIVSARQRQSRGSTRRWDRKPVAGRVSAQVENAQARIVDVSYGGVKFEIERDRSLPPSFRITVASPPLSVDVDLVWETLSGDRHWVCGAAISSANAAAVHEWATLVDGFPSGAEASS